MAKCIDYTMETRDQVYRGQMWHLDKSDEPNEIFKKYNSFIYSVLTRFDDKVTLLVITYIGKINEQKG
ncbi:MAG: hypothetical protein N3D75_02220 [Candidatus Aenigmarchaeota archaeon]|nr:hypothetical protein [Candidatus Aenigmarchaeota archaeon]